jgi:XTP/dITP diphosphohydrolase
MSAPHVVELLVATTNQGKAREVIDALLDLPLIVRTLNKIPNLRYVDELGITYEENAALKALSYSQQTGLYALADDSGLEVDALGGLPGLHSARFAGVELDDKGRTEKLLKALAGVQGQNRKARFVSVLTLAGPDQKAPNSYRILHVARGECSGRITEEPLGANGFGYDPVFAPDGYEQTFGELPDEVKSKLSHRAQALSGMRNFLKGWLAQLDRESTPS